MFRAILATFLLVVGIGPVDAWKKGIAPVTSSFNGGLSQTNFQGVEMTFLNIAKDAQEWKTVTGLLVADPDPVTGFNFDTDYYPRQIKSGTNGLQALVVIPSDAERSWDDVASGTIGAYTYKWDGGGAVSHPGFTLVSANPATGNLTSLPGSVNNVITLRPTVNRPSVGITNVTSSVDYVKNIRLYYTADQADVDAGYLLAKKVRERWAQANFGVARFLNWQTGSLGSGNNNMPALWAHRRPTTSFTYGAQENRTAYYAGVTDSSAVANHYVLATFNHPLTGTAAATDKQLITILGDVNAINNQVQYLNYNGREDPICYPTGTLPTTSINTSKIAAGYYATLMYDALLECWLNWGSGNAAPGNAFIQNGPPPEIHLRAAIELGAHPWFLTPTYAADAGTGAGVLTDYMSSFIDMVRAGAPSWMIPVWEPPNELWNSQFDATNISIAKQTVRNGGIRPDQGTTAPFLATSFTQTPVLTATNIASSTGAPGGLVRITVASTANLTTGEIRTVTGANGTVEANGVWPITVISGTTFDLDGSVFANTWTSGGSITGQTTFQISGTVPPLGANLTGLGIQPSGVNGFSGAAGYVVAVSGSTIIFDSVPTAGSWAGDTGAATFNTATDEVTLPFQVTLNNTIVFSGGTLPSPLVAGTIYYVRATSAISVPFTISATSGGPVLDLTGGTGPHTSTKVYALTPNADDKNNTYGTMASNLGQLLKTKYGVADPKNQTQYKMALGVQGSLANYASGTTGSRPRATAKNLRIVSGGSSPQAHTNVTHISPANYFNMSAYGSGAQETALADAWNGKLFRAGIVNGVMTLGTGSTGAVTFNTTSDTVAITYAAPAGSQLKFTTTGTLPSPLVAGTTYFTRTAITSGSGGSVTLALTEGGSTIDLTGGSGTHTGNRLAYNNTGLTTMNVGDIVFGFGLPAPFGPSQVTIASVNGGGVYTLSDLTINVDPNPAPGTALYSGVDPAAPAEYIDSVNSVQVMATIESGPGTGVSGNQMVVSSMTPGGVGFGSVIYLDSNVTGAPITSATRIVSQLSGTPGGVGTYILDQNRLVTTPTTLALGSGGLQTVDIAMRGWKTFAQGFNINKMAFYEGGYSPDYDGALNGGVTDSTTFAKVNLLRFAAKWVLSTTSLPAGTKSALLENYAYTEAMTDGTFTAEYPSSYYLDGRYPSSAAWAIWENLYFPLIPPLVQGNIEYNN